MTGRLTGKRAIISGAAGGIASAAARAFAREGAVLGLADRPGAALDSLAAELGETAMSLPVDLTDEAAVEAALTIWDAAQGGLDVVYACAGVQLLGEDDVAHRTGLDVWHRTFAVNATGTFLLLKFALPIMMRSGSGSVIVCGSPTGLTMAGAGNTAYSASKAAAMALARVVAADYAEFGIRSNVIIPGTTDTPLIADLLRDPQRRAELERKTPLGRLATPDDLAGVAVFLAADESSYATGANFVVDGGLTQR